MIIGIIGATSNIASKAYLPVYAGLQDQHRFILYSRDWERAEKVRQKYKFEYATTDLAALETVDLVIIHAATSQHFQLSQRYLKAGVHVLMDKPISQNLSEVRALYQLAEEKRVLFVIGFNRRFAPQTQKLKAISNKNVIKITKNLANHNGNLKFQLYDIFSHPLDTLIYLLDDEINSYQFQVKQDEQGQLERALVLIETGSTTGIATMNLNSGAYRESFEVESPDETMVLSELTELESFKGIDKQTFGINGWKSSTFNRGFDDLVNAMIKEVQTYQADSRLAALTRLKQDNILKTHEIIANMLGEN